MFTIKNNNYAMATLDNWCVMVKTQTTTRNLEAWTI